jgi:ABC-type dipeptide/oligopeptide/nickel transport system ATPase component
VKQEKLSVLLVEQNAAMALTVADHGYVMENGRIVLEGPADRLRNNSDIKEFYLGLNEGGARKSYHDTKHYRRRCAARHGGASSRPTRPCARPSPTPAIARWPSWSSRAR